MFHFSLLTFYVLPRRPHLPRVSPADPETLQPADHDAAGRGGRCARRAGSLPVRNAAARHQERADTLVPGGQRTYPLPDLPRRGHHPGDAVRQIHRPRQHLRRRDARPLRHVAPQFAHRPAQLLDLDRGRCDDHRIRRFGGTRGPDRAHGSGHRLEHRTAGAPQLQTHDAAAVRAPPSRRSSKPRSRAWSSCWKS